MEEGRVKMEVDPGVMQPEPRSAWGHPELEETRRAQEALKGAGSGQHLDLALSPELQKSRFLLMPPSLQYFVMKSSETDKSPQAPNALFSPRNTPEKLDFPSTPGYYCLI